jgi:hypothetical protein
MQLVNITKPLMFMLSPQEQSLLMRGLGELPAKESRDLLNRLEMSIIANERPAPAAEPDALKPVSQQESGA